MVPEWQQRPYRFCVDCGQRVKNRGLNLGEIDRCAQCQGERGEERKEWLMSLTPRELALYVEGIWTGAANSKDPRLVDTLQVLRDRLSPGT